jgi:hypothetical protein
VEKSVHGGQLDNFSGRRASQIEYAIHGSVDVGASVAVGGC